MNYNFTKNTLTFILLTFCYITFAQTPIWTEDFDDGDLPLNWTTYDASGQISYGFGWTQNGYYFANQPVFTAATASNGFMFFNSDSLGSLSVPHDIRLTTDAIDCSNLSTVQVRFSNQYAYFSQGNVSIPELGVSTDGINFTYLPILQNIIRNDLSNAISIETVNISTLAAGQATVYLQFRWRGNFEYSWRIDDVELGPLLNNDVAILENTYAGATSEIMSISQIDTLRFLASIANLGANLQTDVDFVVEVIEEATNSVIHTQTHNFDTLIIGDTIQNFQFPQAFLPDTMPRNYTIKYSVNSTVLDDNLDNNVFTKSFETKKDEFMKVATSNVGVSSESDNNWTVGTQFFVYNGSDMFETRYANAIKFGITNTSSSNNVLGLPIQVLLEKGIDSNNNGLIESSERTLVASGLHTFTTADVGIIVETPITDISGNLYELESNTSYLVSVKYTAVGSENMFLLMNSEASFEAADLAASLNNQQRYSHYLDIGNTGNYDYINNFNGNPIPVIGLLSSSVILMSNETIKLEKEAFTLFPNPANEFTTATIALEGNSEKAKITVYNIHGQIMDIRQLSNVQNEQVYFNLENYASGTYVIAIDTDFGQAVKQFVVKK